MGWQTGTEEGRGRDTGRVSGRSDVQATGSRIVGGAVPLGCRGCLENSEADPRVSFFGDNREAPGVASHESHATATKAGVEAQSGIAPRGTMPRCREPEC